MRVNLNPSKHTDMPTAFRLVQQVLKTQPRSVHDIVSAGVQLYETENPDFARQRHGAGSGKSGVKAGSTSASTSASGSAMERMLVQARKTTALKLQPKLEIVVGEHAIPPGHPWVSTNFFKRFILPVLSSQNLITLRPRALTSRRIDRRRPVFEWHLTPKTRIHDPDDYWTRLIAGVHPGVLGREYKASVAKHEAEQRDKAFDVKRVNRSDRDVLAWAGRPQELTVKVQRMHLSTRRRRNRDGKEMRAILRRYEYDLEHGLDPKSEEGQQRRLAVDLAVRRLSGYEGSKRHGRDKRDAIRTRRRLAAERKSKKPKRVQAPVLGSLKGVTTIDTHSRTPRAARGVSKASKGSGQSAPLDNSA